ncbi:antibiotic biosynthesis monooxygenase [Rhizobium sp. TRM95111]|uniref:antibiotic biosynthesis monooxygenase n=1 Tax=Rhizobium alarense TaxID=2846851 RepID=UPI001F387AA2|nr:antibiotic biosynthesis monooxygenase [Rhizobium alarense]MCF3643133.1 antibiotic biosynthesis monooxygenase [Rhizobium alarense]
MTASIYRTDKFTVPAAARSEFLDRVAATHALLRTQPGFVRDLILEKENGVATVDVVTVAEWRDEAAILQAKATIAEAHRRMGFDPGELMARLGIKADMGTYRAVDI